MPTAIFLPGYVWHLTHRCHQKAFLLKFARDRRRYLRWFFEADEHLQRCLVYIEALMLDNPVSWQKNTESTET